jgi:hypothetical protein
MLTPFTFKRNLHCDKCKDETTHLPIVSYSKFHRHLMVVYEDRYQIERKRKKEPLEIAAETGLSITVNILTPQGWLYKIGNVALLGVYHCKHCGNIRNGWG